MNEACLCPVCNNNNCYQRVHTLDEDGYDCPRCGKFILVRVSLQNKDLYEKSLISHVIRKAQNAAEGRPVRFYKDAIKYIITNQKLPSPAEQANNSIIYLGNKVVNTGNYGDWVYLFLDVEFEATIGALIDNGENKKRGISYILDNLLQSEHIETKHENGGEWKYRLTFKGWEHYQELQRTISNSRTAFMAMKFGDPMLENIVSTYFRKAVQDTGYTLKDVREDGKAGLITVRMELEIRQSRFLVADLTHANDGAYWEAGFAHGLGKPVFYTCKEGEKVHFDTAQHLIVFWKEDSPQEAADRLKTYIRNTLYGEAKQEDAV